MRLKNVSKVDRFLVFPMCISAETVGGPPHVTRIIFKQTHASV